MGCTVRDKSIRNSRKSRSNLGLTIDYSVDDKLISPASKSASKPENFLDFNDRKEEGEKNYPELDENNWGYYTEDRLEDLLLKNLEFLYNEALCKIVSLGYEEHVAVKSILRNGHCYGSSDVLSNILHNSLAYLNNNGDGNFDESEPVFRDLKQLEEYSLAGMVCLLQQVRPQLSKGDAMWCLLMSDLNVGRASTLEIPVPPFGNDREMANSNITEGNSHSLSREGVSVPLPSRPSSSPNFASGTGFSVPCKFHGCWDLGGTGLPVTDVSIPQPVNDFLQNCAASNLMPSLTSNIQCPQSFSMSPPMKLSLLKRNAASGFSVRFQGDTKAETQEQASSVSSLSSQPSVLVRGDDMGKIGMEGLIDSDTSMKQESDTSYENTCNTSFDALGSELPLGIPCGSEILTEQFEESKESNNLDIVSSILGGLGNMSLDEKSDGVDDQRNRMIMNVMHQIRELEVQLKDRIDWAHQKAMQAARKLSNDLTELKMLRMEREETLRLKKGKQALEDTTMKRLSDMENALRKASGQVDRANAAVRRLETENAEIRAEMEASKLSAAESATTCLEVAKREKKCLKRLLACERQKTKLQDEVAEEKQKIAHLQQQLHLIKEAQKETEIKWRQELKAKELAIAQVEEERRAKEAAEVAVKRRQEALRCKIDIDFQRHKDDIQRLEQELSRLKASAESAQLKCSSNNVSIGDADATKKLKETTARMLHELQKLQEPSRNEANCARECLICMKDEVSVVFLPCAHQILCVNCNNDHEKQSKTSCPSCSIRIEQRIRVYGTSS